MLTNKLPDLHVNILGWKKHCEEFYRIPFFSLADASLMQMFAQQCNETLVPRLSGLMSLMMELILKRIYFWL